MKKHSEFKVQISVFVADSLAKIICGYYEEHGLKETMERFMLSENELTAVTNLQMFNDQKKSR